MALTKGLVELMSGQVIIGSLPKRGSLLFLTVPVRVLSYEDFLRLQDKHAESMKRSLPPSRELKILIVDDNPFNRNITQKLVSSLGHSATTATDGVESVNVCEKDHFDLIFMDLAMPRMDGYHAARAIRQGPNSSAIIVALTASTESETSARCHEAGMDGCISKPVSRSLLNNTITAYKGRFSTST